MRDRATARWGRWRAGPARSMRSVTLAQASPSVRARFLARAELCPRGQSHRAHTVAAPPAAHRCFAASAPLARTTRTRTAQVNSPAAAPPQSPHRRPRCTAAAAAAMRQRAEHDGSARRPGFRPVSRLGKGLRPGPRHRHHSPGPAAARADTSPCRTPHWRVEARKGPRP